MYYNSCLAPSYFTAIALTLLELAEVNKEKFVIRKYFRISNTGSFFGAYKEEETENL